jgi:exodeoxyribonuclease-3
LKLYSWNVNGIRAAQRKGFLAWLYQTRPDILCLQETKCHPDQLDEELRHPDGYEGTYWAFAEKKGYSGVAQGYKDSFRSLYPERTGVYSWWATYSGARERNVGWRLDYFFVSSEAWPRVVDAAVHADVLGSDHCPVSLTLTRPLLIPG